MRKALVVVDFQVDFVSGSLGSPYAAAIEAAVYDRVSAAIASGEIVVFTKDTHFESTYADSDEGRHIPALHCIKGTEGHEIFGKVRPLADGQRVYEKITFGCPRLAEDLASEGYDEIEVCGLVTNICVIANAVLIKSQMPECRVYVDTGRVATYDPALGESALAVMESMCIEVIRH